ncbi:TetR/AcrR family transcriptional regulator [Dactylosporangium sp. CA-139114]|uniref:TetR/AcrR family transcriptional regulator n=1 Tax=Dactylosporangium sp. CA-139114 TaxID=3239931 RepID=UPI003D963C4B
MASTTPAHGVALGQAAGKPGGRRTTGRRAGGDSGTREAILAAARDQFAAKGFDGASLRVIAAAAGVDTGLIRHFFGSKDDLFAATLHIPDSIVQRMLTALAGDAERLGERMVDTYLHLWEDPATAEPILAIARSAISSDKAADRLRAILGANLFRQALPHLPEDHADARAALAGAHLMGIALARYVVRVPPLVDLDRAALVAFCAPAIQRYLTQPLP